MVRELETIKPKVRALRPYSLNNTDAAIKINQNENPFDLPLRIREETLRRLKARKWSRYPEFVPATLIDRLSDFAGWPRDGILVGNGSNELIQALLMVTVGEGSTVLISEPTFTLYRQVTTVLGGEVKSIQLTSKLQYDTERLRETIDRSQPDVTIICSPNNPTGCVIDDDALAELLRTARGLVAVDEAYQEFAGHSVAPLLQDFRNLIVLRTFSKAMAMAGLRVGYLLATPALAGEIGKALLPYNLNVFSQTAGEVAAEMYDEELRPLIATIVKERDQLFHALSLISGLTPVPTEANFILVHSQLDPRRVFEELLKRDILIRDVSGYPMLGEYFRVSVGTPEENDLLIHALKEILVETSFEE
jgi:histidinol-phosphate aminotransferase